MKGSFFLSLLSLAVATPLRSQDTIHNEAVSLGSDSKFIPDSYIIVFKEDVTRSNAIDHQSWVQLQHLEFEKTKRELQKRSQIPMLSFSGVKHTFDIAGSFLGYSGHFDEGFIERIRQHPDVAYVERDSEVHTMNDVELQNNAPWGLARISHRDRLTFGTFNKYLYSTDGGDGVDVYVIDTGTFCEHVDFEDRAHWGKTIPHDDEDADGNGHGTHCAGTIAGKKFGVAKKANIWAVKVLKSNGAGTMSDVVKGIEWATNRHSQQVELAKSGKGRKGFKGSAANMSLGGTKTIILDLAVNAAVDTGLHFAVAAGNDNSDSCKYSPSSAEKAITVGASTLADERAFFSNYGKCNDIFAPGLNILSTWTGSKYAVNTISGTSMASPHIAGLIAYFLSLQPAKESAYAVAEITPLELKKTIIAVGTPGTLTGVPSNTQNVSHSILLFSSMTGSC